MGSSQGLLRTSRGTDSVTPPDLADRWELLTGEVASRTFAKRKDMLKAVGKRPYRGVPVDKDELRGRWMQVRKDTQQIVDMLAENVKMKPDGRVLLPKELIASLISSEASVREGGFD